MAWILLRFLGHCECWPCSADGRTDAAGRGHGWRPGMCGMHTDLGQSGGRGNAAAGATCLHGSDGRSEGSERDSRAADESDIAAAPRGAFIATAYSGEHRRRRYAPRCGGRSDYPLSCAIDAPSRGQPAGRI